MNNNTNSGASNRQSASASGQPRRAQRTPEASAQPQIERPPIEVFREKKTPPKKKKNRLVPAVIVAVCVIAAVIGSVIALDMFNVIDIRPVRETTRADYAITAADYYVEPEQEVLPSIIELGDETECEHALLMNMSTGTIIAEKLPDETAFPASITKIMTAIVAIENIPDLEETVTLDYDMFTYIYAENASTAGFYYGERVKAIDLLYGLILPSGADAALGLAKMAAGNEDEFVKLMNDKAEELKMTGTHFTNCTGLQDINHYSTASDLYKMLRYALRNQTFYDVFTTFTYTTSPTNVHPAGVTVNSTIKRNYDKEGLNLGYVIGGKTGFTYTAKQCMATLAYKDGTYYALIVLGCGDGTSTHGSHAIVSSEIWERFLGEYPSEETEQ